MLLAIAALLSPALLFGAPPDITPKTAAALVKEGKAVLVDVREPAEWKQTGVAAPAVLLAKSDFDARRKDWDKFLKTVGSKKIIVYCRSGARAGVVAAALKKDGYDALNSGGLAAWEKAGLPVRKVKTGGSDH